MNRVLPLLLLAGCPWIGAELHDNNSPNDDTDSGEGIEFIITGIEPTFGPTGVTTEVVIFGDGFEPDESEAYEVYFDTRRATITDVQLDAITVEVPSLVQPGLYDIELVDDDDATSFPEAFTAYTNRGNGSSANGTGAIGLLAAYTHVNAEWPLRRNDYGDAFFSLTTGEEVISPAARFGPGIDQCSPTQPAPPVTQITLPDASVLIESDLIQYALEPSANGNGYRLDGLRPIDMHGVFSLPSVGATDLNPSLGIDPLFELPDALTVLRPALGFDSININQFFLGWSLDGRAEDDFIAVEIELWESDWSEQIESVFCAALDDGSFRVPPAAFQEWRSGLNLQVRIARVRNLPTLLSYNRSESGAVAAHWVVGPLVTQ